jgi:molybdopterin converting factor small subunit
VNAAASTRIPLSPPLTVTQRLIRLDATAYDHSAECATLGSQPWADPYRAPHAERVGALITIEVWLYGPLARYAPARSNAGYSQLHLSLPDGSTMRDLVRHLAIPRKEKGITFVNGELTDMPRLHADLGRPLHDGDRVGLLHNRSMWPFQYRHMAKTSPQLEKKLRGGGGGVFHSSPGGSSTREGR